MGIRKRRRRDQVMIPTASMGDIAFLLIIFFIICSSFTRDTSLQIDMAQSVELDTLEESRISVAVDKEGRIFCQGKVVGDAKALEHELSNLLAGKTSPKQRVVMLRCDKELKKKQYEPVIGAIAKAGGLMAALGDKNDAN